jgi:tetratricopeptide (TPR) repeat protein
VRHSAAVHVWVLLSVLQIPIAHAPAIADDEDAVGRGLSRDFNATMEKKIAEDKKDKAELFVVQGKWEAAYNEYSKFIEQHPRKNMTARMQRMLCANKLKRWQQVIDDGMAIMNGHEGGVQNRSKVLERRGIAYAELKMYDKACADFAEEARLWPDSRRAYVQLVRCYNLAGKKKEAAEAQKKIDELDKDIRPF